MPHHYNCGVTDCHNSFRNAPNLHYYRIPKDKDLRKDYTRLLRNDTLKLNSTRVCSVHFEGGEKLSRNHLPSLFPWTVVDKEPSRELKRLSYEETVEQSAKKKRPSYHRENIENLSSNVQQQAVEREIQTLLTGATIDSVQKELLELRELKMELMKLRVYRKEAKEEHKEKERLKEELFLYILSLKTIPRAFALLTRYQITARFGTG